MSTASTATENTRTFFNESLLDKEKMTDAAALESLSERTNASHCTCLSTNTQKEFCATTCDTC